MRRGQAVHAIIKRCPPPAARPPRGEQVYPMGLFGGTRRIRPGQALPPVGFDNVLDSALADTFPACPKTMDFSFVSGRRPAVPRDVNASGDGGKGGPGRG